MCSRYRTNNISPQRHQRQSLDNLESATALRKISVNAGMLATSHNPKLACVPADWPEKDGDGNTIREGGACIEEQLLHG